MINVLSSTAFSAGVLSPAFFGRVDVDKYDLGLAEAWNFFVLPTGGIRTRPGFEFLSGDEGGNLRLARFRVTASEPDYLLVFTPNTLRIMRGGQFLRDGADILSISTAYGEGELVGLNFSQKGLVLTITTLLKRVRTLTFDPVAETWTLEVLDFLGEIGVPGGLADSASAGGTAGLIWAVTAVFEDGTETSISRPTLMRDVVNITTDPGHYTFRCVKVERAKYYRWYRSIIVNDPDQITIAEDLGFIGESRLPRFTDNNIIPDFSIKPPIIYSPFANAQLLDLDVTNGGSGYAKNDTDIVLGGAGENVRAWPVILDGEVIDVLISSFGEDIEAGTTFSVINGGGTGATLGAIEASPAEGNYPSVSAHFQQRQVFAATGNFPNGVWGTDVGSTDSFHSRQNANDNESFAHFLDIPSNDPIKWMIALEDSLFLFHGLGVSRLAGTEGVLGPNNPIARLQTNEGAGDAAPVMVGSDIIYSSTRGTALFNLARAQDYDVYSAEDISILASHLFEPGRAPRRLAWQNEPNKLLWVLRNDGTLACCTFVRSLGVVAWTEHRTQGRILDIIVLREADQDVLYLYVERQLDGEYKYSIERMGRFNDSQDDFVDCFLRTNLDQGDGGATFEFEDDTVTITFEETTFDASWLGADIRAFGGLYEITEVTSPSVVVAQVNTPPTPDRNGPQNLRFAETEAWSRGKRIISVSGLTYLGNTTCTVVADGDATLEELIPSSGDIELQVAASRVVVGLPIEAYVRSLPITNPQVATEHEDRLVKDVSVRFRNTRGAEVGVAGKALAEVRNADFQNLGDPIAELEGVVRTGVEASWQLSPQIEIRQRYPFSCEVLGFIVDVEE